MRCIIEICAAGPPKLIKATRVQTCNASRIDTPCAGVDRMFSTVDTCVIAVLYARPGLALCNLLATPSVQRVIHDHSVLQHFVVIGEVCRQPVGDSEQPLAL